MRIVSCAIHPTVRACIVASLTALREVPPSSKWRPSGRELQRQSLLVGQGLTFTVIDPELS